MAREQSTDGADQIGWFDALGRDVPREQRVAAAKEAQKMGVEATPSSPWIEEVARLVESDAPKEAIETVRIHLDWTGTYRFLAVLCTPVDQTGHTNSDPEVDNGR